MQQMSTFMAYMSQYLALSFKTNKIILNVFVLDLAAQFALDSYATVNNWLIKHCTPEKPPQKRRPQF